MKSYQNLIICQPHWKEYHHKQATKINFKDIFGGESHNRWHWANSFVWRLRSYTYRAHLELPPQPKETKFMWLLRGHKLHYKANLYYCILVFSCFHSTYQKLTKIFLFHSKKNLLSFCSHLGHGSVQFISYTKKERKPCRWSMQNLKPHNSTVDIPIQISWN